MKRVAQLRLAVAMLVILGLTIPALAEPAPSCRDKNNKGRSLFPVTFVNNYKGPAGRNLYVFIKGIIRESAGAVTYYLSNANGDVTITPVLADGQYVSLPAGGLRPGPGNIVCFPQMEGLRTYVSLGTPLKTCCSQKKEPGAPVADPNGWTPPPLAPSVDNYNTIYDFLELTWVSADGSFGANTTQVDMFGIPIQLELKGTDRITKQPVTRYAGFTKDFDTLMTSYMKLGTPWTNLVLEPVKGKVRRIIAPYHGIELKQNPFPAADMNKYINDVFTAYYYRGTPGGKNLQTTVAGKTWTGNTLGSGHPFKFRVNDTGDWLFEISQPGAKMTYENQLENNIRYLVSPVPPDVSDAATQTARDLGAQLIRTTLLQDNHLYQGDCPASFVAQFYKNKPIQQYAKFWHDNGINNLAYSFGYDDTCNQSSTLIVEKPTALTITVGGVK